MHCSPIENLVNDTVLRLKKILYGQSVSLTLWFDKLTKGLEYIGFKPSSSYPCMFMSDKMILLVCVNDCLWFSKK